MNQNLFDKYISNSCSQSNVDSFFKGILNYKKSDNSIFLFQKHWNTCKNISDDSTLLQKECQQLDVIHHQINLRNKNIPFRSGRSIWVSILTKAAILIFIPILTLFIYTRYFQPADISGEPQEIVMNEVISPIGSRINLELSDGTKVWLNHGSKLIYPQHFKGDSRKVKLQGEGYFKVAHNTEKPFIVERGELDVVVTGTEFNMKSYKNDNVFEVTLESGKIFLKHNSDSYEMNPGQHLSYNRENKGVKIQYVNTEKYLSWKDGKLIFEDDSFETIANRLSRWYNVDFEITDSKINEYTYTATFIDEPLYQILEMLEIVTPIECKILDRNKLPDGTYSKRKISVSLKNEI